MTDTLLVRLKPFDPRRGFVLRRFTFAGIRFQSERGWYRVEKPVAERLRVPYFACRGYVSQSESFAAGVRFADHFRRRQTPIVFHLGDHDPSGIDMTRDNADRLHLFAGQRVEVRRLALNMEQIEEFNPPPNPAKETYVVTLPSETSGIRGLRLEALTDGSFPTRATRGRTATLC